MSMTLTAYHNLPGKAGKPGEFHRWLSVSVATVHLIEAPDFKNNTVWIRERVTMRSIDGNPSSRFGYFLIALPAKQPSVIAIGKIFQNCIGGFLFTDVSVISPIRLFAKSKRIRQNQGSHLGYC